MKWDLTTALNLPNVKNAGRNVPLVSTQKVNASNAHRIMSKKDGSA